MIEYKCRCFNHICNKTIIFLIVILLGPLPVSAARFSLRKHLEPYKTYVVSQVVDLDGGVLEIPERCILKFKKNGKFTNGTIIGNNTSITAPLKVIFDDNIRFQGSFISALQYEWLYDSTCNILTKYISIKDGVYRVNEAVGANQWQNIKKMFERVSGSFKEIHFNKSYVLNNLEEKIETKYNQCVITTYLRNIKISGGSFYNAGLCFLNWDNIEISDMQIYGRYHNYDRFVDSMNWDEMFQDQGSCLCYNNIGISLSSPFNSDKVNTNALVCNVRVDCCYNGIYIGRWDGHNRKLSTVRNVRVTDCQVNNVIYHAFASCNSENIFFDNNTACNSYLGMFVDISRGSINVECKNCKGINFPQPFKIATNSLFLPTSNCTVADNYLEIVGLLSGINSGSDIIISGSGTHNILNNKIHYKSAHVGNMFTITQLETASININNNHIWGTIPKVMMRMIINNDSYSNDTVFIENNSFVGVTNSHEVYGLIFDEKRKDYILNTINFLIKENEYDFHSCDGDVVNLNLWRTQGYNPENINGNIKYQDNSFGSLLVLSTSDYLKLGTQVKFSY